MHTQKWRRLHSHVFSRPRFSKSAALAALLSAIGLGCESTAMQSPEVQSQLSQDQQTTDPNSTADPGSPTVIQADDQALGRQTDAGQTSGSAQPLVGASFGTPISNAPARSLASVASNTHGAPGNSSGTQANTVSTVSAPSAADLAALATSASIASTPAVAPPAMVSTGASTTLQGINQAIAQSNPDSAFTKSDVQNLSDSGLISGDDAAKLAALLSSN